MKQTTAKTEKPLTASVLADALSCFWNAALGAQKQGMTQETCVAEGINAVSVRLAEVDPPKPAPTDPDEIAIAKCLEVLAAPCQYGHGDLGDFLAAYLKGEDSLESFLWNCDVTWLGSKRPHPSRENDDE